jgi:hypothetical protein
MSLKSVMIGFSGETPQVPDLRSANQAAKAGQIIRDMDQNRAVRMSAGFLEGFGGNGKG